MAEESLDLLERERPLGGRGGCEEPGDAHRENGAGESEGPVAVLHDWVGYE